mgnify:CR=1 FL=1
MSGIRVKRMLFFVLGMLTIALGFWILTTFIPTKTPEKGQMVEDWGEICLWQDVDGINLSVRPKGCFSTSCTEIKQKTGTVLVDMQLQEIHLASRFILMETSRFPLPCIDNCLGGGIVLFNLSTLLPNDYTLWFGDQKVGEVMVFSGRETPRQCFTDGQE